MANALHSKQTVSDGIHVSYSFTYADSAARLADTSRTSDDLGKFARQLDDNTIWMLIATTPTWSQVSSGGGTIPTNRTITAGSGLTGGGDLSADRTINVGADPSGSIIVQPDYIAVGVINDYQHGILTGSNLHATATLNSSGFMSAESFTILTQLSSGSLTIPVRNESGITLSRGRAVYVAGWDSSNKISLIDYADYTDPNKRPAVAILPADINNNSTGIGVVNGYVDLVDTSMWSVTDQLVLGPSGTLIRPPPDNITFSGEIQNVAQVVRSHPSHGDIMVSIDGLTPINGDKVFALEGSAGLPSKTNRYLTSYDPLFSASFITTVVTSSLPNARSLTGSNSIVITDNGPGNQFVISQNVTYNSASHAAIRQLIHLASEGPFESFGNSYCVTGPSGPFPTASIWYADAGYTKKIVEQIITYNPNKTLSSMQWKAYAPDGTTLLATATDTITYTGIFESSRTRIIT